VQVAQKNPRGYLCQSLFLYSVDTYITVLPTFTYTAVSVSLWMITLAPTCRGKTLLPCSVSIYKRVFDVAFADALCCDVLSCLTSRYCSHILYDPLPPYQGTGCGLTASPLFNHLPLSCHLLSSPNPYLSCVMPHAPI
jgi:hypothetical protein